MAQGGVMGFTTTTTSILCWVTTILKSSNEKY
jgi:hypothetical protein